MELRIKRPSLTEIGPSGRRDWTLEVIFYALNGIALPISAVQTWAGYKKVVVGGEYSALAIALLSAILFFALNYRIKEKRIKGESTGRLLFGYLIPFGISFFGNFNGVYTMQVGDKYFNDELSYYQDTLENTKSLLDDALENELAQFKSDKESALKYLKFINDEVCDSVNPGWGRLARKNAIYYTELIDSINQNSSASIALTAKVQEIFSKGKAGSSNWAKVEKNFDDMMDVYEAAVKNDIQYDKRKAAIDSLYKKGSYQIDSLRELTSLDYEVCIPALKRIRDANNRMLDNIVGIGLYDKDKVETMKLENSEAFDYLKPSWTIMQLRNFRYPYAVILAIVFSLVIDLGCLLYIYIMYSRKSATTTIFN